MVRSATSALPDTVAVLPLQVASADALRNEAPIRWPSAANENCATVASAWLVLPPATTAACRTSADSAPFVGSGTPEIGYSTSVASSAPPDGLTGPVSTIGPIAMPSTCPLITVACPLKVVGVAASACSEEGHAKTLATRIVTAATTPIDLWAVIYLLPGLTGTNFPAGPQPNGCRGHDFSRALPVLPAPNFCRSGEVARDRRRGERGGARATVEPGGRDPSPRRARGDLERDRGKSRDRRADRELASVARVPQARRDEPRGGGGDRDGGRHRAPSARHAHLALSRHDPNGYAQSHASRSDRHAGPTRASPRRTRTASATIQPQPMMIEMRCKRPVGASCQRSRSSRTETTVAATNRARIASPVSVE